MLHQQHGHNKHDKRVVIYYYYILPVSSEFSFTAKTARFDYLSPEISTFFEIPDREKTTALLMKFEK